MSDHGSREESVTGLLSEKVKKEVSEIQILIQQAVN